MKIVARYKGAIIGDPKIGRPLAVNEKNLPILLQHGHDYLVEIEAPIKKIKKKLKDDIKIAKKRIESDSSDIEGTSNA